MKNLKTVCGKCLKGMMLLAGFFLIAQLAPAQKLENTLLWKVESDDHRTSYLFGTIHVIPQSEFELKNKASSALRSAEILALEIDMSDPSMQMKMMQMSSMKDGTTLDELLDADSYRKLDTMLQQSIGASIAFMNGMKPFVLSSMLIGRLIEGQPASFEGVLVQEAKRAEMPIMGLETLEDQMAIFDRIPYASQAEDLKEMINEEEKMKKMYAEMIRMYRAEELEALHAMIVKEIGDESQTDELLDARNKKWITIIDKTSLEKSVFYAVGAGHLAGKNGVINLLRQEGFSVTPVME